MTRNRCKMPIQKTQSDRLSLNFVNKPSVNNLSGRGTERRDVYGITTEDT